MQKFFDDAAMFARIELRNTEGNLLDFVRQYIILVNMWPYIQSGHITAVIIWLHKGNIIIIRLTCLLWSNYPVPYLVQSVGPWNTVSHTPNLAARVSHEVTIFFNDKKYSGYMQSQGHVCSQGQHANVLRITTGTWNFVRKTLE